MLEVIVRIARTLASLPRLRVLSALLSTKEAPPTRLAEKLGVELAHLSPHLRRLTEAGLVVRRRSGAWSYCAAKSPYGKDTLSGNVSAWLRSILADPKQTLKNCGLDQVRNVTRARAEALVHEMVYEAATAFGDVRRLQILRHLSDHGATTVEALTAELGMSEAAASRHLAKLRRRGYVETSRNGRRATLQLASSAKTPLHADLLRLVASVWGNDDEGGLRT